MESKQSVPYPKQETFSSWRTKCKYLMFRGGKMYLVENLEDMFFYIDLVKLNLKQSFECSVQSASVLRSMSV